MSTPTKPDGSNSTQARHEWQRRPVLSFLIRGAVLAAPAIAGVGAAVGLSRLLPHPSDFPHALLWFAADTAAMVLVVIAVERVAR
ncbi:MAG: hypothetical protein E6I55_02025, partial [Chloroflexi bacterium]